ncbi:MAG: ribonuclease H-like domain-containing protein [Armatimonadota bacterium]|nr:ribonuclease H-like domain-containing protein [Armatimonadota bacterium]MDW8155105.1 ribonuclease H-like domain-containing protein [Armatimonadota bacterium]
MSQVVVFDVETQNWPCEPDGAARAPRLAVAVAYRPAYAAYGVYFEQDAVRLVEVLREADLVVGFGVRSFDYRVLERYAGPSVHGLPTLDILEDVARRLRRRVGLHHLATATLGRGKSADGWQALRWWRAGQVGRVVEYCRCDVELTWELYRFGCENGYLRYWDGDGRLSQVAVDWPGLRTRGAGAPQRG